MLYRKENGNNDLLIAQKGEGKREGWGEGERERKGKREETRRRKGEKKRQWSESALPYPLLGM